MLARPYSDTATGGALLGAGCANGIATGDADARRRRDMHMKPRATPASSSAAPPAMPPPTAAVGNAASNDATRTTALLFVVADTVDDAVVTFVTSARLANDADDDDVLSLDALLSEVATIDVATSVGVNCALLTPTDVGATIVLDANVTTGNDTGVGDSNTGAIVSEDAVDVVVAVVSAVVDAIVVVVVVASVAAVADVTEVDSVISAVGVGDCVGHADICGLHIQFVGHGDAA